MNHDLDRSRDQRIFIATGEAYESKASAEKGIASVQKNAADAKVVDLTE